MDDFEIFPVGKFVVGVKKNCLDNHKDSTRRFATGIKIDYM